MIVLRVRNNKRIEMRRMAMKNRLDIWAFAEEVHIHRSLPRWFNCALNGLPSQVDEDHIFAVHIPLVMLGWGDQDDIILQLPGKITPMSSHILMSRQMMAYANKGIDLLRMFFQITHQE